MKRRVRQDTGSANVRVRVTFVGHNAVDFVSMGDIRNFVHLTSMIPVGVLFMPVGNQLLQCR